MRVICVAVVAVASTIHAEAQVYTTSLSDYQVPGGGSQVSVYEMEAVDERPEFPGGERGMFNFINEERRYPCEAYNQGVCGRVIVSFVVCPNGKVSNVSVIRGVEPSLNSEAVRIVSAMPQWQPGRIHGENVCVRCVVPIAFRL